jgi:hypothetical protein
MMRNEAFPSTRSGQTNHNPTLPLPFRPSVRPSSVSSSPRSHVPLSLSHHNSRYARLKHDEKDWIKTTKKGKTLHNPPWLSCTIRRCAVYAANQCRLTRMLRRCSSGNLNNLIKVLTQSLTWRCFCAQYLLIVRSPMAWSQNLPVMSRREELRGKDGVRT